MGIVFIANRKQKTEGALSHRGLTRNENFGPWLDPIRKAF